MPPVVMWYLGLIATSSALETNVGRLREALFKNYDPHIRPILNDSETTTVRLAYYINHLLELDEKTETLTTEGIAKVYWTDEHLRWDPMQYQNLTEIHVRDHEIWQPDIFLFFSAGKNSLDQDQNTYATINYKGEANWYPAAVYQVPCYTNYKYYPFDKHECYFEFGSWTHDGDSLHLLPFDNFRLDPLAVTGSQWKLSSYTYEKKTYFMGDNYPYNSINLTVLIQRTSSLPKLTSMVPVISSGLLTLSGFWMELWTTPRYMVGMANFVMMSLHLLNLATSIPAGDSIPLLAQFSATALCLTVLFLVETVSLDSTKRRRGPPPETLIRLIRRIPDKFICSSVFQPIEELTPGQPRDPVKVAEQDWKLLCLVTDRFAFWIFSFIYVIVTSLLVSI